MDSRYSEKIERWVMRSNQDCKGVLDSRFNMVVFCYYEVLLTYIMPCRLGFSLSDT
jgi:hypothetical protein